MKFAQLIESSTRYTFFQNHAENEGGSLVPDLFSFFEKALYEVKANSQELGFNIFRWSSAWHMIKTQCIKL